MKAGALVLATALAVGCAHTKTPDTFVRLEQTECLGPCPVYAVTLYKDGAVKYEGKKNAPRGVHWHKTDPHTIAYIMWVAEHIPAWTCDPARIATDHPESIITVSRRTLTRRIVHDHGDPCAPAAVKELEMDINLAADVADILGK
jgi:hypothetical protein